MKQKMRQRMKQIGAIWLCVMLIVLPIQAKTVRATANEEISGKTESVTETAENSQKASAAAEVQTEEAAGEAAEEESKTESPAADNAAQAEEKTETENKPEENAGEDKPAEAESKPEETVSETENNSEDAPAETETGTEETVQSPETTGETADANAITQASTVQIPNVTGMLEEDAMTALQQVVLPDGGTIEVIKNYEYSTAAAENVVYEQSPVGDVAAEQAGTVHISISMGEEPSEVLQMEEEDGESRITSFGIAEYLEESENLDMATQERPAVSQFGINWSSLPASYEYNWDNSANCWYWGVWVNGVKYTTPVGQYSTDVRHKMQVYCDGTYVYTHITFSRDYWNVVNGDDYRYYFDGEMAAFQLTTIGGGNIERESRRMSPGTHQIEVRHRRTQLSGTLAEGSIGYLTKFEDNVNAQVEFKIPLSEMMRQNKKIDMENVGTIQFFTPNLMYRMITCSGAGTLPLVTAGVSLLVIPGSTLFIKKYRKKKKKEEKDEENI